MAKKRSKELVLLHFPGDESRLRVIPEGEGRKKIGELSSDLKQELARHTGMAMWYWKTGLDLAPLTQELQGEKAQQEVARNLRGLRAGLRLLGIQDPDAYVLDLTQSAAKA